LFERRVALGFRGVDFTGSCLGGRLCRCRAAIAAIALDDLRANGIERGQSRLTMFEDAHDHEALFAERDGPRDLALIQRRIAEHQREQLGVGTERFTAGRLGEVGDDARRQTVVFHQSIELRTRLLETTRDFFFTLTENVGGAIAAQLGLELGANFLEGFGPRSLDAIQLDDVVTELGFDRATQSPLPSSRKRRRRTAPRTRCAPTSRDRHPAQPTPHLLKLLGERREIFALAETRHDVFSGFFVRQRNMAGPATFR
jgi:hypothetical protein